jgi:hypothetical protein
MIKAAFPNLKNGGTSGMYLLIAADGCFSYTFGAGLHVKKCEEVGGMRKLFLLSGVVLAVLLLCTVLWAALTAYRFTSIGSTGAGDQSFSSGLSVTSSVPENKPILLAKRRKKKSVSRSYSYSSGATVRLDPNTATLEELMVLPLVDRKTAEAIIKNRPYEKPENLINVPEVGVCKYRIFKSLIEIHDTGTLTGTTAGHVGGTAVD